jgi:hypothetical protein
MKIPMKLINTFNIHIYRFVTLLYHSWHGLVRLHLLLLMASATEGVRLAVQYCAAGSQMYHSFFFCTAWVLVLLYTAQQGLRCIILPFGVCLAVHYSMVLDVSLVFFFCTAWLSVLLYSKTGSQMYHSFFFCTAWLSVLLYSKIRSQMYNSFSFVQHRCLPF